MDTLHPRNVYFHLTGRLSLNLVVLVVVLLLGGEDFLVHEEGVFVSVVGVPIEEAPCPSDRLQSRSKGVPLRGCALSCVDRPW